MTPHGLPDQVDWPRWMQRAAADVGVRELPGKAVHPRITEFYTHAHVDPDSNDDEVSWCAAAMSCWLDEAGYLSPNTARARKFLAWGEALQEPRLGCIVVFSRGLPTSNQGHVALYCQTGSPGHIVVLGGNQLNSVRFHEYQTARILGFRWPRELDKLTV